MTVAQKKKNEKLLRKSIKKHGAKIKANIDFKQVTKAIAALK